MYPDCHEDKNILKLNPSINRLSKTEFQTVTNGTTSRTTYDITYLIIVAAVATIVVAVTVAVVIAVVAVVVLAIVIVTVVAVVTVAIAVVVVAAVVVLAAVVVAGVPTVHIVQGFGCPHVVTGMRPILVTNFRLFFNTIKRETIKRIIKI